MAKTDHVYLHWDVIVKLRVLVELERKHLERPRLTQNEIVEKLIDERTSMLKTESR